MKKRFSLRYKLILIFGLLVAMASLVEGALAVRTARKAVTEKVETHLIDKATYTAELIDARVTAFFQFFEGIARTPILRDPAVSYREKAAFLKKEAAFNARIHKLDLCDTKGIRYTDSGQTLDVSDRDFFIAASKGKNFVTEPLVSRLDGAFILAFTVPIYDDNHTIIGVLLASVEASALSHDIEDIVVGQTGYCYILGLTGTTIAAKDFARVKAMENVIKMASADKSLASLAAFEKMAVEIDEPSISFYTYKGIHKIASYATMKTTDWTIVINAPQEEFMGTVNSLRFSMIGLEFAILLIAFITVYIVARVIVKPIQKVVSGSTEEVAEKVEILYRSIVPAGTFRASSIKVAEACKAIENAQRDVNISFVNELSLIFDRMGIDTQEVLEAAATKWNFLKFTPGLVGGHCIGVDPYYLMHKSQCLGYNPQVILSGRSVNDGMGRFVASKTVKLMIRHGIRIVGSRVLVLGFTFKENCPDTRNTKVVDVIDELKDFGIHVDVYDPHALRDEVKAEYAIDLLAQQPDPKQYDGIILTVAHDEFRSIDFSFVRNQPTVLFDVKGILDKSLIHGRL